MLQEVTMSAGVFILFASFAFSMIVQEKYKNVLIKKEIPDAQASQTTVKENTGTKQTTTNK